jgi:transcriptional regulatory protein LevR
MAKLIFLFLQGPAMAIFGKQVLKGLQVDFNMVKVALQFPLKNRSKIKLLVFGAHFISRFVLTFSYKTLKNHWVFHVFGENSFSRVFAVVLA